MAASHHSLAYTVHLDNKTGRVGSRVHVQYDEEIPLVVQHKHLFRGVGGVMVLCGERTRRDLYETLLYLISSRNVAISREQYDSFDAVVADEIKQSISLPREALPRVRFSRVGPLTATDEKLRVASDSANSRFNHVNCARPNMVFSPSSTESFGDLW